MTPRVLDGAMNFIEGILDGALAKLDEGLVPFFTSPYGIAVLFVAMFIFLNSMRMKL